MKAPPAVLPGQGKLQLELELLLTHKLHWQRTSNLKLNIRVMPVTGSGSTGSLRHNLKELAGPQRSDSDPRLGPGARPPGTEA